MLYPDRDDVDAVKARVIRVTGVVQGVGFRPFIYLLARRLHLVGWVRNEADHVEICVEGPEDRLRVFAADLEREAPATARIVRVDSTSTVPCGYTSFEILGSARGYSPAAFVSPDLSVCEECLRELRDPADRRWGYAYINCTSCGPRYSIITRLPYDRANTTMEAWGMCSACRHEYANPADRRYHAQPTACPTCGPTYHLETSSGHRDSSGIDAVRAAAGLLREGAICAVKGIGGYHLACDARNASAVRTLRERKFRKEKPFAVMVRDVEVARALGRFSEAAAALITGIARPIVLVPAAAAVEGVAPGTDELGLMLPYAPLHVLLFEAGAPDALVMTSANRSSEPIAYQDADARERLSELADYLLVGERPIARRIDDSVVREHGGAAVILRRARGYAPARTAELPAERPILALGADLKNTVTLVIEGTACVSQHLGDLSHYDVFTAFQETVDDLLAMYRVPVDELLVVADAHPQYISSGQLRCWGADHGVVQHHRAHVASVAAERGAFDIPLVGLALDGTGFGDDGTIWGGEVFAGSLRRGFERVAHLRAAPLPGGDAAAKHPVQAAAGFLSSLASVPEVSAPPFRFPDRYVRARQMVERNVRTFRTTSTGRLFDAAAALAGFTRPVTYEGQAAVWLEQQAGRSSDAQVYPFDNLDFEPLLGALIKDLSQGAHTADAAKAFHLGFAGGFVDAAIRMCRVHKARVVVLSGGVFQNRLVSRCVEEGLAAAGLTVWMNRVVPPNDGGISLGQAALAAFGGYSTP